MNIEEFNFPEKPKTLIPPVAEIVPAKNLPEEKPSDQPENNKQEKQAEKTPEELRKEQRKIKNEVEKKGKFIDITT